MKNQGLSPLGLGLIRYLKSKLTLAECSSMQVVYDQLDSTNINSELQLVNKASVDMNGGACSSSPEETSVVIP